MTYDERVMRAKLDNMPRYFAGLLSPLYPAGKGRFWRAVATAARPTWADREALENTRNQKRAEWYAGLKRYARPE